MLLNLINYVESNQRNIIKKACFHEWKLVKEDCVDTHYHYIYICQKCGEIKVIEIK